MRPNKKYLRNKIVYRFFTDVLTVINRFFNMYMNSNMNFISENYNNKIHTN
jgi:hypothetical protein